MRSCLSIHLEKNFTLSRVFRARLRAPRAATKRTGAFFLRIDSPPLAATLPLAQRGLCCYPIQPLSYYACLRYLSIEWASLDVSHRINVLIFKATVYSFYIVCLRQYGLCSYFFNCLPTVFFQRLKKLCLSSGVFWNFYCR